MKSQKRTMLLISSVIIIAIASLSVTCVRPIQAIAAEEKKITTVAMWTSAIKTYSYLLGMAIEDIAKKNHPWLRFSTVETAGYIYNLKAHHRNSSLSKNTIPMNNPHSLFLAANKLAPFEEKIVGYKHMATLKLTLAFFGTFNPNIKTLNDLVGKKIALGYKTQITWGDALGRVLEELGIAPKAQVIYAGTEPAATALLDGTADVAAMGIYADGAGKMFIPTPTLVEIFSSGKKLYCIGTGDQVIKSMHKKTGYPDTFITIPAGAIKGIDKEIVTLTVADGLFPRDVFPEELIYEITKLLLSNANKFAEYGSSGKLVSPKGLAYDVTKSGSHPGAVRAFLEYGMSIPD